MFILLEFVNTPTIIIYYDIVFLVFYLFISIHLFMNAPFFFLYRMIHISLSLLGIILILIIGIKGYQKHSLSFGGAVAATIVGIIHILSGWRITLLLLFFYGSR